MQGAWHTKFLGCFGVLIVLRIPLMDAHAPRASEAMGWMMALDVLVCTYMSICFSCHLIIETDVFRLIT